MSWEKLLADRAVTPLPATKQELDNLRSIALRFLFLATSALVRHRAKFATEEKDGSAVSGP
jgi:hypothetical protein